ncbi:hypothetical protein NUU61_007021 [Penicillium alfredii]|uniref:Uncharacterized protein n=1 Tax=Penicillium alfredii TaxID=1506179 RepID=A0A9W9F243_9EURO|nr:uncharacterized protein NUU61_007021 [Penicillium alfredii]KAJ5092151.1 hypothetical protein NUU61_007021 [Penicillium alfredii]
MPRPSRPILSDDESDASTGLPDIFSNDASEDDSSTSDPNLGSDVESHNESDDDSTWVTKRNNLHRSPTSRGRESQCVAAPTTKIQSQFG